VSKLLSTDERFKLYVKRVNLLLERRFVHEGMKYEYSLKWDSTSQAMKFQAKEPDIEDLRSFLLDFRRFIAPKEPVFISKVMNDILRFLSDDHLKEEVKKAQDEWKRIFHKMGDMSIIVDGKNLSPEYVLDLWINGFYFHDDIEKAEELERLMKDQFPFVRTQFISSLPALTNIIVYISNVVTHGLKEKLFQIAPGE
jgi:hypothetical protein